MYSNKKPKRKPKGKVPKGSHRMPDGSIMKDSQMDRVKPKKQKLKDNCPDSTRCSQSSSLRYSDNLKVEKTLEKNKEIKESDIFEGIPNSKKNVKKSKK